MSNSYEDEAYGPGQSAQPKSMPAEKDYRQPKPASHPPPTAVASPREVPAQLEGLRYEVDIAHDVLTALQDRLGPVLGPVNPQSGGEEKDACESEVGETIRQSRCQVGHLAGRLRNLLSRLEV